MQAGICASAPELLILVADQYRNYKIVEGKECHEPSARNIDGSQIKILNLNQGWKWYCAYLKTHINNLIIT